MASYIYSLKALLIYIGKKKLPSGLHEWLKYSIDDFKRRVDEAGDKFELSKINQEFTSDFTEAYGYLELSKNLAKRQEMNRMTYLREKLAVLGGLDVVRLKSDDIYRKKMVTALAKTNDEDVFQCMLDLGEAEGWDLSQVLTVYNLRSYLLALNFSFWKLSSTQMLLKKD